MKMKRINRLLEAIVPFVLMLAFVFTLGSGLAFAQTTTPETGTTTPGLPSTGAGGNGPLNILMLSSTGLLAVAGLALAAKSKENRDNI